MACQGPIPPGWRTRNTENESDKNGQLTPGAEIESDASADELQPIAKAF